MPKSIMSKFWSIIDSSLITTLLAGAVRHGFNYHIVGKFGELTRFEHLAKGERKFGELIDQPTDYFKL